MSHITPHAKALGGASGGVSGVPPNAKKTIGGATSNVTLNVTPQSKEALGVGRSLPTNLTTESASGSLGGVMWDQSSITPNITPQSKAIGSLGVGVSVGLAGPSTDTPT